MPGDNSELPVLGAPVFARGCMSELCVGGQIHSKMVHQLFLSESVMVDNRPR